MTEQYHCEELDRPCLGVQSVIEAKDKEIAGLKAEISSCIEFMNEGDYPDKRDPTTQLERNLCELVYNSDDRIAELEAELNCLKSETVRSMMLCDCKKYYRLPTEKMCDKCRIAELKAQLAEHEWISVEDRLPEIPDEDCITSMLVYVTNGNLDGTEVAYYSYETKKWCGDIKEPTHWKTICLPEEKPEKSNAEKLEDIIKNPASFLPECKWQETVSKNGCSVVMCFNPHVITHNNPCNKGCIFSEPEKKFCDKGCDVCNVALKKKNTQII